jgi:hypothetical protein
MPSPGHNMRSPKRQSFWRGITAGIVFHYLTLAILVLALVVLQPYLWTLLFGSQNWFSKGPIDPNSGEGTVLQFLGLLSWFPGGIAAVHWSSNSTVRCIAGLLLFIAALLILSLFTKPIAAMSLDRAIWYWLCAPIGLLSGALLWYRFGGVANK